jgi:hypothetical protein
MEWSFLFLGNGFLSNFLFIHMRSSFKVLTGFVVGRQSGQNFLVFVTDNGLFWRLVLGFELRALHLLGNHSTSSVTPPALFAFS